MMKITKANKVFLGGVLALVLGSGVAHAEQDSWSTLSVGYAWSKLQDVGNLNGVNIKYRYEWDSPFSVIGSFSYLGWKESWDDVEFKGSTKLSYYSLAVGPAYRITDYLSLYALIGANYNSVKDNESWDYKGPGGASISGSYADSTSKTGLMYGFGVQVNPIRNLSIDIGYEGSSLKLEDESSSINGFNIGVGYRF